MTKIPRRFGFRPWFASAFIGAHQHTAAFLAKIDFTIKINSMQNFGTGFLIDFGNFGHVFGQQIHMFHCQYWQFQPNHAANFTRPKTSGIHHMFGDNDAFICYDDPLAIGLLAKRLNLYMGFKTRAIFACCFGISMGNAVRVAMTLDRIIHGANKLRRINQRHKLMRPFRGDDFKIVHAKVFTLGIDRFQPVKPLIRGGKHYSASHVKADILPR